MEKIVNIQNVDPDTLQLQNYASKDTSLITNILQQDIIFTPSEDYLEYFVLDLNKNILFSNVAGYSNYKLLDNKIILSPQLNLEAAGFAEGQYFTIYNFLKRKLSSSPNSVFYIQDISTDRTELRLNTTTISNIDVIDLVPKFSTQISDAAGSYVDFYLNFGDNKLIIANNIALENTNPNDPTVLIKLYEPLSNEFLVHSKCWIVEQLAESLAYQIELTTIFDATEQLNYIGGPNFNLDILDQTNNTTIYQNEKDLSSNTSILGSGSLFYQINSLLANKGIKINIDYTDYSQFVHFSSAQTRLENFYYKLSLVEEYTVSSSFSTFPTSSFTIANQEIWNNKINNIITNFDGYEYFLYYTSGSYAWPKVNSVFPYQNYPVISLPSLTWFNNQIISASEYDSCNKDALVDAIPTYIRDDCENSKYVLFVQMFGQNFDSIWVYLKDITNKFDADNRLDFGISKDIVAQAIRDLGVKLYQNNFSSPNIYSSLLGVTPSGSIINISDITGSLPTPTGFEYINLFITASNLNALEPLDDINKEIYKRIYHNLPYLLKKKGTPEGLRTLINIYGIPDTILRINEFGGKSTSISNNWDNFVGQFNYAFHTEGNGYIKTSFTGSILGDPQTVEFRFKTNGIPPVSPYCQVLLYNNYYSITLEYTGSGYTSGSYNGSIPDLYNEYGTLKWTDLSSNASANIYLPFFDGGWWSVMHSSYSGEYLATDSLILLQTDAGQFIIVSNPSSSLNILYAKNNIYSGYDGNTIGFQSSSFVQSDINILTGSLFLSYASSVLIGDNICYPFSGSFQEFKIYTSPFSEISFNDYVMNPYSIEGNELMGSLSSPNTLMFRAPLGTMLDNDISSIVRTSIHPSITQYPPTQSFITGNSLYYLSGSFIFEPNSEAIYQDQFCAGIKNSVTEKIKIINEVLPLGNTLSQYISIQQTSPINESFTKDVNYVEVAFSPQDEINDDIISQLGSFNIGDYIGDPRHTYSSLTYYPDFNKLRDEYFSKYTHNYNLWDYIRIIKFYDNSLFKMIKDFTPARTGLATGIVIKQSLLERNKYPLPQVTSNSTITFVGNPTTRTMNIGY